MKGKKIVKERKKDLILLGSSLVALLVLVLLLFNLNSIFGTPDVEMDNLQNSGAITGNNVGDSVDEQTAVPDSDSSELNEKQKCMVDLGVSPDNVIFYHSNTCPHCTAMKPKIEELEQEGYDFFWAEGSDKEVSQVVGKCFGDMVEGYVPLFICPSNLETKVGAMTEGDLKAFADRC